LIRLRRPVPLAIVTLLLVLAACGPGPASSPDRPAQSSASAEPRTLLVGFWGEPAGLATVPVRFSGQAVRAATRLFNAELDLMDAAEQSHPYLAEALPKVNTDTWQVFPDGRMETRHRLRPNLTWHDGVPFSAEDFVFAWQVYSNPEFGATTLSIRQMQEVSAPDDRTVVIHWRSLYPDADALSDTFQPLPRHILGSYLRADDLDGLANHAYWSLEYVGVGPYRLVRWEPGVTIEAVAFEGHALGRPKIDRIVAKLIADESVILTTMLAEDIHVAATGLRFEHAEVLKREWSGSQRGMVVLTPTQHRFIHMQLRPDVVQPSSILDVRTRRAFAHAIDKKSLEAALFAGEPASTDTFLHRGVPYYADIQRAITTYAYDVRRSEQLMSEVGYTKASDGMFVGEDGTRFSTEFWGDVGPQFEQDHGAVSAGWRQAGFETRPTFVSPAQLRDGQYRSSFKGMYFTSSSSATERTLALLSTASIPTPANRWAGSNRSAWSSAEFDRLWDAFNATLDRAERNRHAVQMEQLISEELPVLMVFHNFYISAFSTAVKGHSTRGLRDLLFWNVHEWDLGRA